MSAQRLLAHYEQIADAPDAIARLRRFILDLAIRGKLAPQEHAAAIARLMPQRSVGLAGRLRGLWKKPQVA